MPRTSTTKTALNLTDYYVVKWDPEKDREEGLRKMLVDAFRKGVKRVAVIVASEDVGYMERAREVLSEFIAQTIVIWREKEVMPE